jgi:polygalacturonase
VQNKKTFAPIRFRRLENFTLKDVVLLESSTWNVSLQGCRNVNIDNLRIVSFFINSDGICTTTNCQDINVTNCFVHNADDSLEIKAMDSFWGDIPEDCTDLFGPCRNILFENCQVWNDLATPMGITHEIATLVENVTFRNITVLHHTSQTSRFDVRGQISIFPAGGGEVRNVTFENITVESANALHPNCISIDNTHNRWFNNVAPHYAGRPYSRIQNVLFKNININTDHPTIQIRNWSDNASDVNVTFENVRINGKPLSDTPDAIHSINSQYKVQD